MITICFTYFRSLALPNFAAALYALRQQDFSSVKEVVVVDNNTEEGIEHLRYLIDLNDFPVPVHLISFKHGDAGRTHAWSTNVAVKHALTPWVLFTRADYLLDPLLVGKFIDVVNEKPAGWGGFVTSKGRHLNADVVACEQTSWRLDHDELTRLPGAEIDYSAIDSGVWMARRKTFDAVGGLDERLTAWGHAQTHFQWKLHEAGVEFVVLPEVLFHHPTHVGERDMVQANEQIEQIGASLSEMWSRHGSSPYA